MTARSVSSLELLWSPMSCVPVALWLDMSTRFEVVESLLHPLPFKQATNKIDNQAHSHNSKCSEQFPNIVLP